jgi:mannose-6-phosphate isomerase-like protein (cupin superfamily)
MKSLAQRKVSFDALCFVPASHEDPANPSVLKKVLFHREDLQPGRLQMFNWAKLPAGSSFTAHYHEDMQEVFLIVQGTARMVVEGETIQLARGDAIAVQPREVHRMWNDTSEDVDYIVFGVTTDAGGQTITVPEA